jgi:hypothetical protein
LRGNGRGQKGERKSRGRMAFQYEVRRADTENIHLMQLAEESEISENLTDRFPTRRNEL